MGDDLSQNNPWAALFTHPNLRPPFSSVPHRFPDSENEAEEQPPTPEATREEKLSRILEQVFSITLKLSFEEDAKPCVYIEDVASASPSGLLDLDNLENALFERLTMTELEKNLVGPKGSFETPVVRSYVAQKQVVLYLFEAYTRCVHLEAGWRGSKEKEVGGNDHLEGNDVKPMLQLVVRYLVMALNSGVFDQAVHPDMLRVFLDNSTSSKLLRRFLEDFVQEVLNQEESNTSNALLDMFQPLLDLMAEEVKKFTLTGIDVGYVTVMQVMASVPLMATTLLQHSTPRELDRGFAWGETLLGSFLSISCLPRTELGSYTFFENPASQSPVSLSAEESAIWSAMKVFNETTHTLFLNLFKSSTESKRAALRWLGSCVEANSARAKLWNVQLGGLLGGSHVGDAFALNLSALLLALCHPFCCKPLHPTLLGKVDPFYCPSATSVGQESRSYAWMPSLKDAARLLPEEETAATDDSSQEDEYGFVTEIFFLTHRLMDVGVRVAYDKIGKLSQELNRIQRLFQEAQLQGGSTSEAVQSIQKRMEAGMSRYLSLKAVLLCPSVLQLNMEFCTANAAWLSHLATRPTGDDDQKMRTAHEITFPLPTKLSPRDSLVLSRIPEFTVENVAETVVFLRRFNPQALEEQGKLLQHLLTFILVFMGSPERMRNPHLRAKLAECLESLLPHAEEQAHRQHTMFSTFQRERLFKEHPHRLQVVPTLLHVFVSIEMTGQSVAFEQKFNYRRPMYLIMDYLWQLEEHRNCFSVLAAEAEQNMEAMDPPLFLRFVNLLINDAIFLLDEALSYMSQLRDRQQGEGGAREGREEEANMAHMEMIARFHNVLGKETIHTLEMLTGHVKSIFTHTTMVDRIATLLNYFLLHLVGPKKKNFKVKDMDKYEFKPAEIVTDICSIYIHLYESRVFCKAVAQDGRSYSPQLFQLAEAVLAKIGKAGLIGELQEVAVRVEEVAAQDQTEEEMLAGAPEEFLDPIMSTLMRNPVILPSSKKTVDRSTIARHLLSDQSDPFNRMPLTMDMVEPNEELRSRIQTWIEEQKAKTPE